MGQSGRVREKQPPLSYPPLPYLNPRHETQRKWVTLSEIENTPENDVSCPNLEVLPVRPDRGAPAGTRRPALGPFLPT